MADIYMRVGDLLPEYAGVLEQPSASDPNTMEPIPITGATVQLRMRNAKTLATVFQRSATVVDAPTGQVKYSWQAGDTTPAGYYLLDWIITFSGSRSQTVPSRGGDRLVLTA